MARGRSGFDGEEGLLTKVTANIEIYGLSEKDLETWKPMRGVMFGDPWRCSGSAERWLMRSSRLGVDHRPSLRRIHYSIQTIYPQGQR
jgi:hypothetical protein